MSFYEILAMVTMYKTNMKVLGKLREMGEDITEETLIFLYSAGALSEQGLLDLYESKKFYEKKYNYITHNGKEVLKFNAWSLGYNQVYMSKLLMDRDNCIRKIFHSKDYDILSRNLEQEIGHEISITYGVLDDNGNFTIHTVSGILSELSRGSSIHDFGSIVLKNEDSLISLNGYNILIVEVVGKNMVYRSEVISERIRAFKLNLLCEKVKSENILEQYLNKFGTIEGLAYLNRSAKRFIEIVNPSILPINNLFAWCFEVISLYQFNDLDTLEHTLYAYQYVLSGRVESLRGSNFGYSLYHFLSDDVIDIVKDVCNYVVINNLKALLPTKSFEVMLPNYAHLTHDDVLSEVKKEILEKGFLFECVLNEDENNKKGGR